MMTVLNCKCGSAMEIEGEFDGFIEPLVLRFFSAHAECGFATPLVEDAPSRGTAVKVVRPSRESK